MPVTNMIFGILFGMILFNLFIHIQVALRSRWQKTEKAFSLVLFSAFMYILLTYIEYKTPSADIYLILIRIQYVFVSFFFLGLFFFIHSYLDEKPYKFIYFYAALFILYFFIRLFLPYSGIYKEVHGMDLVTLDWGDRIYMISGKPSFFIYFYPVIALLIPIPYLIVIVVKNIRNYNRRKCIFILFASLAVLGGAVHDLYIMIFSVKSLFMSEASFAVMLLLLSLGLTDQLIFLSKTKSELMKSLEEKEILLKEIHHRVKNNLSILISLINLQKDKTESSETRGHLITTINRLYSIARVHQMLYSSGNFTKIDLKEYLKEISRQIQMSFNRNDVRISVNSKNKIIALGIIKAIPLGLIINEIITNSFKHAFRGNGKGEININLSKTGTAITLSISDSGKGFGEKDPGVSPGLGNQLIELLSKQIGAELELNTAAGAEYCLILPFREENQSGNS